jgi:inositol-hexakisphosphate/diphosphoinositol-pentakisphosphate 1-kinase
MLLNEPIESWPRVDVLLGFYSTGYPIDKVISYVKEFKPVCINDLESQKTLWERSSIMKLLSDNGVPTARSITLLRNSVKMSQTEIEE